MQPTELKSGDSDDLEALFDQIAAERSTSDESESLELEGLEQTPVLETVAGVDIHHEMQEIIAPGDKSVSGDPDTYDVFQRLGGLTRTLHDALRELGYDKSVESAVGQLPDARARLTYIANLTGQAAEKVLSTVEVTQTLQDGIHQKATELDEAWDRMFSEDMSLEEFKKYALETHQFLKNSRQTSQQTNSHLTDIMMAQDFHDLTGQVVNRIATMAQSLEDQLVRLLLDATPADRRVQVGEMWLSGPAINPEGKSDVCGDQTQVDDLLESLGF